MQFLLRYFDNVVCDLFLDNIIILSYLSMFVCVLFIGQSDTVAHCLTLRTRAHCEPAS